MDLAFCVDDSSAMVADLSSIQEMVLSIFTQALGCCKEKVRVALVKVRSFDDEQKTIVHQFTGNRTVLKQWLLTDQPARVSKEDDLAADKTGPEHGSTMVFFLFEGEALHEVLHLPWDENASRRRLVVFVTGSAPHGLFTERKGKDPWSMMEQFKEEHITLVVVGKKPSIGHCAEFYYAMAKRTGRNQNWLDKGIRLLSHLRWSIHSIDQN